MIPSLQLIQAFGLPTVAALGAGVRATMDHHHRRLGGACCWGEHLVVCGRMIEAADGVSQRRAGWQSHGISAGHAADCAAE